MSINSSTNSLGFMNDDFQQSYLIIIAREYSEIYE